MDDIYKLISNSTLRVRNVSIGEYIGHKVRLYSPVCSPVFSVGMVTSSQQNGLRFGYEFVIDTGKVSNYVCIWCVCLCVCVCL